MVLFTRYSCAYCWSLHATYIQFVATRLDGAEDKVKAQVRIALIKTQLKIRCLSVIGEIHHAPFNVKDAIGCAARDGGEDAAAAGKVCTTLAHNVGAVIAPVRKNGVIKGTNVVRRRQACGCESTRFVDAHEVGASIGVDVSNARWFFASTDSSSCRWPTAAAIRLIASIGSSDG